MSVPPTRPRPPLSLLDLTALVAGYGLAALLVRAFWPATDEPPAEVLGVLGFVYLWLGLAMSGPIVLLLDRRALPRGAGNAPARTLIGQQAADPAPATRPEAEVANSPGAATVQPAPRYTRAELAWLSIGAYWIVMMLLVVPSRLQDTPLAMLAVLQLVAAVGLWVAGPRAEPAEAGTVAWTHRAAVGLLWTWPIAWVAMILLSKSII